MRRFDEGTERSDETKQSGDDKNVRLYKMKIITIIIIIDHVENRPIVTQPVRRSDIIPIRRCANAIYTYICTYITLHTRVVFVAPRPVRSAVVTMTAGLVAPAPPPPSSSYTYYTTAGTDHIITHTHTRLGVHLYILYIYFRANVCVCARAYSPAGESSCN